MLQKRYIGLVLLLLMAVTASAQKAERDFIRKGNRFFKDSVYVNAEVNYRKALEVNPQSTVSMFNLGNTLAQQNKLQEAMEQYVAATKMEKNKDGLAQIYHNMGVLFQFSLIFFYTGCRNVLFHRIFELLLLRQRITQVVHGNSRLRICL